MTNLFGAGWQPPHPVEMRDVDEILRGGYDLHVHAAPDMRPRLMDAPALVEHYRAAGLAGALLKDHFFPTVGRNLVLNQEHADFRCLSSCALNTTVGGLNPVHVEVALAAGVDWVFMPTATSAHFVAFTGRTDEVARLLPGDAEPLTVLAEDGALLPEVHDVLDVVARAGAVLASGHLSPAETRVLFAEAKRRGIERRVVTHASISFIAMPAELQRELAADGAVIEHCYGSCLYHPPVPFGRIAADIAAVGAASCYLSSDLGQPHNPTPVDGLRAGLGGLQASGTTRTDLGRLVVDTPRRLVDSTA